MLKKLLLIFFICQIPGLSFADKAEWEFRYKPLVGEYEIYSGELDDASKPNKSGASISIKIIGDAAKQIFNNLGQNVKNECQAELGEKMHMRNDVVCYLSKDGKYVCFIGVNLKTGKSTLGVIC